MSDMQDDGEEEPITLYFWPTPNGLKISIMLEELTVPYRVEFIDLSKGAQFAPEFLAISPIRCPPLSIRTGPTVSRWHFLNQAPFCNTSGANSVRFILPANVQKRS
jgi:Glutathione S-transferase, N-terminal domain